jgi:hypothetical protein
MYCILNIEETRRRHCLIFIEKPEAGDYAHNLHEAKMFETLENAQDYVAGKESENFIILWEQLFGSFQVQPPVQQSAAAAAAKTCQSCVHTLAHAFDFPCCNCMNGSHYRKAEE